MIGSEGESGLESPLTNTSGITLPTYQAWAGGVSDLTVSATGSVTAADAALTAAGYKKDSAGFFASTARKSSSTWSTRPPTPTTRRTTRSSPSSSGPPASTPRFQGLTVNAWNADVADGDFQLTLHWGSGGITPYNMFDNWLDDTLVSQHRRDRRLRAAEGPDDRVRPGRAERRLDGGHADRRAGADR